MNVRNQKKMAASILKVGENKVWIDPDKLTEVSEAITKNDIRGFIKNKTIKALPEKGVSRARARKIKEQKKKGRKRGSGKRKGSKYALFPKKRRWIIKIRALRKELTKLKKTKEVKESEYRRLYRLIKGGSIKDKKYLKLIIQKMRK